MALLAACKSQPPPSPEVQVSTDLTPLTADVLFRAAHQRGSPLGQRIAGLGLGAAALAADGGAPTPEAGGDLRWDVEPYGAIAAARRDELLPMPASGVDVPDLWRDRGGTWVAIGGRARVLLVNVPARSTRPTPVRLWGLTEPWLKGKVALAAPTGGAALAHFAALYTAWGEARMRAWLKALRANEAQVLGADADVRLAVVQGRAIIGLIGSDEAAKAAAIAPVTVVYPDQKTIGTFVWPTALSRPKNAAHPDKAALLAEALADRATEQLLVARETGFIPLRAGIPVPPGVRSAANLRVVSVEPHRIAADIEARRAELSNWAAGNPLPESPPPPPEPKDAAPPETTEATPAAP